MKGPPSRSWSHLGCLLGWMAGDGSSSLYSSFPSASSWTSDGMWFFWSWSLSNSGCYAIGIRDAMWNTDQHSRHEELRKKDSRYQGECKGCMIFIVPHFVFKNFEIQKLKIIKSKWDLRIGTRNIDNIQLYPPPSHPSRLLVLLIPTTISPHEYNWIHGISLQRM